jgi:hypothetical protein
MFERYQVGLASPTLRVDSDVYKHRGRKQETSAATDSEPLSFVAINDTSARWTSLNGE